MIELDIPGFGEVEIEHAVFDYNGTLACEGVVESRTLTLMQRLQEIVELHVITADTFGMVKESLKDYTFQIQILTGSAESEKKAAYVQNLGASGVISFGNGRNDVLMLQESRIGVVIIKEEGCSGKALESADLVVKDITDGLQLLLQPLRLKAGLRF